MISNMAAMLRNRAQTRAPVATGTPMPRPGKSQAPPGMPGGGGKSQVQPGMAPPGQQQMGANPMAQGGGKSQPQPGLAQPGMGAMAQLAAQRQGMGQPMAASPPAGKSQAQPGMARPGKNRAQPPMGGGYEGGA